MKITVFGASGKVGRLVIEEALQRGHEVVAFTHSSKLPAREGLTTQQGDIHDAKTVNDAIAGSDAIISALGSWGTSGKDVLASAMKNIVPAARANSTSRLVSLTGSDARASGDKLSLVHRISYVIFGLIAGKVLGDGEKHIQILEASGLEWTVVRSPRMTKEGKAYSLGTKRPNPWASVGRPSVAMCLVDLAENSDYSISAPYIYRA